MLEASRQNDWCMVISPRRANNNLFHPPRTIQIRVWCSRSTHRVFSKRRREPTTRLRNQNPGVQERPQTRRIWPLRVRGTDFLLPLHLPASPDQRLARTISLSRRLSLRAYPPRDPTPADKKGKVERPPDSPSEDSTFLVPIDRDSKGPPSKRVELLSTFNVTVTSFSVHPRGYFAASRGRHSVYFRS